MVGCDESHQLRENRHMPALERNPPSLKLRRTSPTNGGVDKYFVDISIMLTYDQCRISLCWELEQ